MARRRSLTPMRLRHVRRALETERHGHGMFYGPLSRARLAAGDSLAPVHDRYRLRHADSGSERELGFTPHALGQLAAFAGVPMPFLERLPLALGIAVLRGLVAARCVAGDSSFLFRVRDGSPPRIRAILPGTAPVVHDLEVFDDVASVVPETVSASHVAVSEDVFHLRVLLRDVALELGDAARPDEGMPGLDIRSSETGRYPLQVRAVVFRKVCSNGLTIMTASRKLFVGEGSSFDRLRFREALQMTLETSVSRGRDLADRLRSSRSDYVKDPGREIRSLFRQHRLGNPRSEPARWVAAELLRGASLFGVSRFEVVQAFTAVARGLEHDLRLRWEDAMAAYLLDGKRPGEDAAETETDAEEAA